jgi:hypothetical protein
VWEDIARTRVKLDPNIFGSRTRLSLLPLFRIACFFADIGFERRGKTDLISGDELVHLGGWKATRRLEEAVSSRFASGAFATAVVGRN